MDDRVRPTSLNSKGGKRLSGSRMADLNCAWIKYCDTTAGNQVANREHKPYPKHKRLALLTRSGYRLDNSTW